MSIAVEIEDYFDFLEPDDIRIKGTRIGIESVLVQHLCHSKSPRQIAWRYRTLTLEQIYATLLYYERNKAKIGAYVAEHLEYVRKSREDYWQNPPPDVIKLKRMHAAMKEREQSLQMREA